MHSSIKKLAGVAGALALFVSPTVAMAAPNAVVPVKPLVVVSVFGTQASAQAVCTQVASAAAAAGAAVSAQGQTGCVLPATDAPPPVGQAPPPPPPPPPTGDFGINWILLGLGLLALIGGISTLFDDDDDVGSISPA